MAGDGPAVLLGIASAGGNGPASPLLEPAVQAASGRLDQILPAGRTCHLDRG